MIRQRAAVEHLGRPDGLHAVGRRRCDRRRGRPRVAARRTRGWRRLKSPPTTSGAAAGPAPARWRRSAAPSRCARASSALACTLATQIPQASRTACTQRRSGKRRRRRVRCATIRSRRARIALAPPPFDWIRSGQRVAIARRSDEQAVARGEHEPVLGVELARQRRRPPRRHLLQQRDVPLPAGQRGGELRAQVASGGRLGAAVHQVPGEHSQPHRDRRTYTAALAAPLPHRSRADRARARRAARPRGRAQARTAARRRRSRARRSR